MKPGAVLAIDTNVLVRLIVADDPRQAAAARDLLDREEVLVTTTVLLETDWVLRSAYGLGRSEALNDLRSVCGLPGVVLSEPDRIATAISWSEAGMDFADALHLAGAEGCDAFVTFDRKLATAAGLAANAPAVRLL